MPIKPEVPHRTPRSRALEFSPGDKFQSPDDYCGPCGVPANTPGHGHYETPPSNLSPVAPAGPKAPFKLGGGGK